MPVLGGTAGRGGGGDEIIDGVTEVAFEIARPAAEIRNGERKSSREGPFPRRRCSPRSVMRRNRFTDRTYGCRQKERK